MSQENKLPIPLPSFAHGATMYQIFLRAFTPQGTLKAAEMMIPHLAELGISIAYLCPIFEADDDMDQSCWSPRQIRSGMNNPKNPYRMNDYYKIDPEYGTDDDLKSFVETAHRHGLKIMLDLVYLHCGPKAALTRMEPEMLQRDELGKPIMGDWKFPLLNFKSPKLREYLWSNMIYFVEKFGIDGYRCDVGGSIPLDFWEEGRRRVNAIKKDFIMLNEDFGTIEQQQYAFELAYGFRAGAIHQMMKGEKTPAEIMAEWSALDQNIRIVNHLDNHDIATDEFENRHEKVLSPAVNDMALAFIFGLPGLPLLYNGQEIADSNRHSLWANHDHGNHLGIDWSKTLTLRGRERLDFVKKLIALRKKEPVLFNGNNRFLDTTRSDAVFAFQRKDASGQITCVFNFSGKTLDVSLKDAAFGEMPEFLLNSGVQINLDQSLTIQPYGYCWIKDGGKP